jgi:hypothetical protein
MGRLVRFAGIPQDLQALCAHSIVQSCIRRLYPDTVNDSHFTLATQYGKEEWCCCDVFHRFQVSR